VLTYESRGKSCYYGAMERRAVSMTPCHDEPNMTPAPKPLDDYKTAEERWRRCCSLLVISSSTSPVPTLASASIAQSFLTANSRHHRSEGGGACTRAISQKYEEREKETIARPLKPCYCRHRSEAHSGYMIRGLESPSRPD
jgi:hypothetical protein